MAESFSQMPSPAPRLAPPPSPLGPFGAPPSCPPRRQTLRPMPAGEDARLSNDLTLSSWSISQCRPVSPTKHDARKAGLEISGAVFTDTSSQVSLGTASSNNVRVSSLRSCPAGVGELLQVPPLPAFEHPDAWLREYAFLRAKLKRPADAVTVYHDYTAAANSRSTMRHACLVHPLPDLEKVQEALRRRFRAHAPSTSYDVCEQQCTVDRCALAEWDDDTVSMAATPETSGIVRGAHREQRNDMFLSPATLWCVGGSSYENEIVVRSTATGQRLLRILDPKMRVSVTALQHAPFRGFIKAHSLHVLPVRQPHDILRLKASQLAFTDYVWCGLQDGTVRLLPADHHHVRACGASSPFSKAPSAALVYELPRYQGGAIVSIVCSPCHDTSCAFGDSPKWGLPNRVSDAIQCLTEALSAGADSATAAGQPDCEPVDPVSRKHLSLVCIAATDASIVIWDARQVYEAVATAQQQRQEQKEGTQNHGLSVLRHSATGPLSFGCTADSCTPFSCDAAAALSVSTGVCSDVITFDCSSAVPGLQNMQVRSSCTLVQVKPLAKLSGGFAGLTALRWVSSLIVAGGCDAPVCRDARMASRDSRTAPCTVKDMPPIELTQAKTRLDKREEERRELGLTEEEMQGVERELEHMMPPLAAEPAQSLRVNLLVASDCMGTLHLWNLDEELHRCSEVKDDALGWPSSFGAFYYSSLRSISSHNGGRSTMTHGSDASQPTPGTSNASARRTAASKGRGGIRRSDRVPKSRRACRGLGLAEARENRARLSELPSNRPTSGQKSDGEVNAVRKSLQRPSMGRSSTEEHDPSQVAQARWPQSTVEQESGGLSDGHGTARAPPPSRKSLGAPSAAAHQHPTLHSALPPQHPSSAKSGIPVSTPAKTKKTKKVRNSGHETSAFMFGSPLQSTSPSRGSAHRSSNSPGRLSESRHPTQLQGSVRSRTSVQRGTSLAGRNGCGTLSTGQDLVIPTQAARCQIRFGQGAAAAIADVVVDLPPHIHTTLRRIPKPSHRVASLQHRPTEEEVDARMLENEFEELSEEKALFFAFRQLEMYVAVDGAMSTVRCVPKWLLPDDDERELFRERNDNNCEEGGEHVTTEVTTATAVREWMAEEAMSDRLSMGAFDVQLRKRLLDVHAQPITQLFLDPLQGRLWVAREDGFASIFDTHDKSVVARMPRPSADALLAPPSAQEWAKLQEQALTRIHLSDARVANGFGLERHKECRDLPPNHLTQILPIAVRPQRALLLCCSASADGHQRTSDSVAAVSMPESPHRLCQRTPSLVDPVAAHDFLKPSALKLQFSLSWSSDTTMSNSRVSSAVQACGASGLICVDGRSDMKNHARSREAQQWRLLRQLQLCRAESFAVCQMQRRCYYALCEDIGRNAAHVIQELGHYTVQLCLRTYFQLWKDHLALFHHTHLMRRQRTARLERERTLACRLECVRMTQVRGAYYMRWQRLLAAGKCHRQKEALFRFARATVPVPQGRRTTRGTCCRGPLPTSSMMGHFHRLSALRTYWRTWQVWADAQRLQQQRHKGLNALQEYQLPFSPTRSHTSSAASMATPNCRVVSGYRTGTENFTVQGTPTPYHSIHSSEVYVRNASLSPPLESACRTTASGNGSAGPPSARRQGVAEAVSTAPPPALELLLTELLRARVFVFHFSDARSSAASVLDESWSVILENAESGAESDDDDDRRFSVFCFALLPLLQGLISTAEEVLPNLFNESVAEEVLSMLVGIVLAMDYVTTDAECTWWTLREAAALSGCSGLSEDTAPMRSTFDASLLVLRAYAMRAFALDSEAAEVLRGLSKGKKVLAQFLDFAMERAVTRRVEQL
ncbi:hypothetical protein, conserved [Leishmania tarentolae]|uniref:Uncharacterized protein n=1 Tax=Leishmania tarentolae TaxID=5689 RepID=A0A640KW49_LEITA|nr:hypothetical protein, conserved [Leishmania tarentolae]